MGAVTPVLSYPYPLRSDGTDLAAYYQNLAQAVENHDVTQDGQIAGLGTATSYAGLIATLLGNARAVFTNETTNPVAAAPTAYGFLRDSTSKILGGQVFIAPPSGKVAVSFGLGFNAGASNTGSVSIQLMDGGVIGSGTVLTAAADGNGFASTVAATAMQSRTAPPLTGLTPNHTYNVVMMWKSASASITLAAAHVWIAVDPKLA